MDDHYVLRMRLDLAVTILDRPSPNYSSRRGVLPDAVILHDTEGQGPGALAWLTSLASGVSAHYLVDRDGAVYRLVSETDKAWHAGDSNLWGRGDCNRYSIGIELVDWSSDPYPKVQLAATVALVADLCRRHAIPLHRVVGHEHVAPGRKTDPGLDFPWRAFLLDVAERIRHPQGGTP